MSVSDVALVIGACSVATVGALGTRVVIRRRASGDARAAELTRDDAANSRQDLRWPAVLATLLLLAVDVLLYRTGLSWTYVHYESFLPAAFAFMPRSRLPLVGLCCATVALLAEELLVVGFGINLKHLAHSPLGAAVLVLTGAIAGYAALRHLRFVARGLIVVTIIELACMVWDKKLTGDRAAAAYTPHFARWSRAATPAPNGVHSEVKAALSEGHGVVLVVWESLGVPIDERAVAEFRRKHPQVRVREEPYFEGSTTAAEARYLCAISGDDYASQECIPKLTRSEAFHGNSLSYFSRGQAYEEMGFRRSFGRNELRTYPTCEYAYTAVCDKDLIRVALEAVKREGCNGLFYVLTIDSHFPYAKYGDLVEGLLADVGSSVEVIRRELADVPNCRVVVAGDHPPPLAANFRRDSVLVVEW
jgi:hypothetical protein